MCVCIGRITDSAVTDPEVKTSKQISDGCYT